MTDYREVDLPSFIDEKLKGDTEWWRFAFPNHNVEANCSRLSVGQGFIISQTIRVLPKAEGQ